MPNHIITKVTMEGIASIPYYSTDGRGKTYLDFQKLIPMPSTLEIEDGSMVYYAVSAFISKFGSKRLKCEVEHVLKQTTSQWSDDEIMSKMPKYNKLTIDEILDMGKIYVTNMLRYQCPTWYDWSVRNWGTKWNSYELNIIDNDNITFQTAWGHPEPIIGKISEMFPLRELKAIWADENASYNTGITKWKGGLFQLDTSPVDASNPAVELYLSLWDRQECYEKDEAGNYHHKDCDNCNGC